MNHYLQAEFYRTTHRNYFYVLLIVCSIILVGLNVLFFVGNQMEGDSGVRMHLDFLLYMFIQFLPSIGFYMTILLGDMTFSEEYKFQTMRNTVFYGTSRATIFFGKFLNALLFCFLVLAVLIAVIFGSGILLLGTGPDLLESIAQFGVMIGSSIPLWIAGAALSNMLYCLIPSNNLAVFAFFACLIIPTNTLKLVGLLFHNNIVLAIRDLLPSSYLDQISKGYAFSNPWLIGECWMIGAIFTAFFLAFGYLTFRQMEIK
ncbi:MAG: hypothetical protein ACOX6P_05200 [Candidatus Merdivicinus sp.]|jgi:ABC-2 type transport system permease protein